jgi:predicted AAA+ superfamily ATPase
VYYNCIDLNTHVFYFSANINEIETIINNNNVFMCLCSYDVPESLHTYPAPAFAVLLDTHRSKHVAEEAIRNITVNRYIDRHTNVMFIDMSVYNYMLELTQWVKKKRKIYMRGKFLGNFSEWLIIF